VSAGTVSYESDERGVVRLLEGENGWYDTAEDLREGGRESFYLGGEEAVFRATGGEVPAFEQRVDFPILPLLEEPATVEGEVAVPNTQPLTLRWSRGVPGMLIAVLPLGSVTVDGQSVSVQCDFDGGDGQGTIPADVMGLLEPGSLVRIAGMARGAVQAGDYAVDLYAGAWALSPDRQYQVTLTIQ